MCTMRRPSKHGGRFLPALYGSILSLASLAACGGGDFDPQTKLNTVRFLAVEIDNPYPKPGDTVTLTSLSVDGREDKARPMSVYWFPTTCVNPKGDLYYRCFEQFLGAGGQAASSSTGTGIPSGGVDVTPFLKKGDSYSFQVPTDIISSHGDTPGQFPYGYAVAFNVACSGRVKIVPVTSENPQELPLGCFDEAGVRLGWQEYVFGITRIYVFDSQINTNPSIEALRINGASIDPAKTFTSTPADMLTTPASPLPDTAFGLVVNRCEGKGTSCVGAKIAPAVPAASQEVYPEYSGTSRSEQIWASYYSTVGEFDSDARLLYATSSGAVSDNDNEYFGVSDKAVDGVVWIVARDNRGGVSWVGTRVRIK